MIGIFDPTIGRAAVLNTSTAIDFAGLPQRFLQLAHCLFPLLSPRQLAPSHLI